jgi:plastocyanin
LNLREHIGYKYRHYNPHIGTVATFCISKISLSTQNLKISLSGGIMMPRIIALVMGLAFLFPSYGKATIHDISIVGLAFVPGHQTITQGDTVQWTNNDPFQHTSTSDNGVWNSGALSTGQSFMFAFSSTGVFPYHCSFHHTMFDTLTVVPVSNFDLQISIEDFFFNPAVVHISIGQTIRWLNNGSMEHTSTSNSGVWDSNALMPGQFFDFTFNTEGVYNYACSFHPSMTGTVIVGKPDSVTQDIEIVDFSFNPSIVEVTAGQYVRWINLGTMAHTSTDTTAGRWDSGNLDPGAVFTIRADWVGTYHYVCSYHPTLMAGTLIVDPPIDRMVDINDNFFNPAVIQIQPGQSVEWMNMGTHNHTSTSDTGVWDSGTLTPGQHFIFTFPTEGVYHYHCNIHPLTMKGTIIVGKPDSIAFDIHINDNFFSPADTSILLGRNIRWINFGANMHTTTDTTANHWDSGTLNPGDVFTLHADSAGVYHYICNFHLGMAGALTVIDTASGGCHYVLGDINNNGATNGIDVVYGVGYFKGGPIPPISCICPPHGVLYAAGDVNGSCVFNGIDITYFVGYLKGGPALIPCPSCPPTVMSVTR